MSTRPIINWLLLILLLILGMVAVGGITRLTESGLSMVDWRPLMGAVPPLDEAAWQEKFYQYRQYPEYLKLKPDMTLREFKGIFFWEYLHRLLGRLIGIAFLVPYLVFLLRKRLERRLALRLAGAFLLGGAQGILGWYMVKSGLVDNPRVSHFRLAAHLLLAFALFGYILWIVLDLKVDRDLPPPPSRLRRTGRARSNAPPSTAPPRTSAPTSLRRLSVVVLLLIVVQIVYGAFVAGLDAGYAYNTYPRMLGRWIPPGFLQLTPAWTNWINNPATIQFVHRHLALVVWLGVVVLTVRVWRGPSNVLQKKAVIWLFVLTLLQVLLGITTLILSVPVPLGVAHQVLACLLLGAAVSVVFSSGTGGKGPTSQVASKSS